MNLNCCGGTAASLEAVASAISLEDKDIMQAVDVPPELPPIYQSFVEQAGKPTTGGENAERSTTPTVYQRIHIHLHSARIHSPAKWRLFDQVADPYVVVETVGEDTGSTAYFPVGKQEFPVLSDSTKPVWDAKGLVLAKKGTTHALHFSLLDKNRRGDDVLLEFALPEAEWPEPVTESFEEPGEYTKYVRHHADNTDLELVFSLKVTEQWLVTPEDTVALRQDTDQLAYSQHVIAPAASSETPSPDDMSLLQCWKHKAQGDDAAAAVDGAVLWVLGRNDCFMHPHVANSLFFNAGSKKYDLYVLNYSMNGCCRQQGWVRDAHFNSHNKYGDFNRYNDQIAQALKLIQGDSDESKTYKTLLGYAHSTGAPVLLNYLMELGDSAFDGFIFNSPFLDWGFVGGDMNELILKTTGFLEKVRVLSMDQKLGVVETPEELKETPVNYLGQEIVFCSWSAKLWANYHFNFSCRPLYSTPMTGGFAIGVTAVHKKLQERHEQKKVVTSKPFLCITSRGDDVLKAAETISRADWIGPVRYEVELNDNGHDVFLSQDCRDTAMAIDMVKCWMKGTGFL